MSLPAYCDGCPNELLRLTGECDKTANCDAAFYQFKQTPDQYGPCHFPGHDHSQEHVILGMRAATFRLRICITCLHRYAMDLDALRGVSNREVRWSQKPLKWCYYHRRPLGEHGITAYAAYKNSGALCQDSFIHLYRALAKDGHVPVVKGMRVRGSHGKCRGLAPKQ